MRVLLGSGGFRTAERVETLIAEVQWLLGDLRQMLFVPYALADHDRYLAMMNELVGRAGFALDGIHQHPDPHAAVANAQAIFVGGGNTFRLLSDLYRYDLLEVIRSRVRQGMPYLGVSAGSNVACPTLQTTNDMPITLPPSFEALGLVPFQLNPHYYFGRTFVETADGLQEHFGETRDDRLAEFHEMNDTPVIGLWEGGLLRVEDDRVTLVGSSARLFLKGQPPRDLQPGPVDWE